MSDDEATQNLLVQLRAQLDQSKRQQERLKGTLTRMLSLIDDLEKP